MRTAPGAPRPASAAQLPPAEVRQMFDRIAGVYDVMNTAMTAGLHRRWRARAAAEARVAAGARVLDVATGTGDLALELAPRVAPGGEVVGADFAEGMLARARAKAARAPSVSFEWADAMELPYADGSFDAATVGFGARNFDDLDRGLAEMARVVRPGGRVVVLEITTPSRLPLSLFYGVWFDRLVPLLGRAINLFMGALARLPGGARRTQIAEAYAYLPRSVKRFPDPDALAEAMCAAGLEEVRYALLAGGIVAVHAGTVSARAA